jgi:hypothetical protein
MPTAHPVMTAEAPSNRAIGSGSAGVVDEGVDAFDPGGRQVGGDDNRGAWRDKGCDGGTDRRGVDPRHLSAVFGDGLGETRDIATAAEGFAVVVARDDHLSRWLGGQRCPDTPQHGAPSVH